MHFKIYGPVPSVIVAACLLIFVFPDLMLKLFAENATATVTEVRTSWYRPPGLYAGDVPVVTWDPRERFEKPSSRYLYQRPHNEYVYSFEFTTGDGSLVSGTYSRIAGPETPPFGPGSEFAVRYVPFAPSTIRKAEADVSSLRNNLLVAGMVAVLILILGKYLIGRLYFPGEAEPPNDYPP